jgi:hypothetical protein
LANPYGRKIIQSKEKIMINLLWKLTHPRSSSTTNATVVSCEWVRSNDHVGEIAGHYQVKFTYLVGGQVNHGEFCHQGIRHIAPYAVGELLAIDFDPRKPARYHFGGAAPNYEKLEAIVVMTVFALIAGYVLYAF